jgi:uncharacterized membrane protein
MQNQEAKRPGSRALRKAIMCRPLNEFGGWLRFFLILWWIHLISAGLQLVNVTLFLVEGIPTHPTQLFKIFLLVSIQWSIPILFATRVIRTVRIKSAGTPNEIIKILWRYLAVFFFVWILVPRVAYLAKLTPHDTTYYANLFQNLIIAVIILGIYSTLWIQYFRKSKRVLAYYGKNAGGVLQPVPQGDRVSPFLSKQ